jgi:hypothetical protein
MILSLPRSRDSEGWENTTRYSPHANSLKKLLELVLEVSGGGRAFGGRIGDGLFAER